LFILRRSQDGIDEASRKRSSSRRFDESLQRLLSGRDCRGTRSGPSISFHSKQAFLSIRDPLTESLKHPNTEWRQRLGEIQDSYLQKNQDTRSPEQRRFKVVRQGVNGVKRTRSSIIPEVHTSRAHEVRSGLLLHVLTTH
jgi:hypothetical protein